MKTELRIFAFRELSDGCIYNEFEGKGSFALSRDLTIQPECQRS